MNRAPDPFPWRAIIVFAVFVTVLMMIIGAPTTTQ